MYPLQCQVNNPRHQGISHKLSRQKINFISHFLYSPNHRMLDQDQT